MNDYLITWQGVDLLMSRKTIEGIIGKAENLEKELATLEQQLKIAEEAIDDISCEIDWEANENAGLSIPSRAAEIAVNAKAAIEKLRGEK